MKPWLALVLAAVAFGAAAQTTYRWVDKDGKVHYSDIPPLPADAKSVSARGPRASAADATVAGSYEAQKAAASFPVTLYTTADCGDPCRKGRDYLTARKIPFSETAVATQEDLAALKTLIGNVDPIVPILKVGNQSARGFEAGTWNGLLDAAGYPKAPAKPGASAQP